MNYSLQPEQTNVVIPIVMFLFGVIAQVLLPYLLELRSATENPNDHPGVFSWRYFIPKLLSALVLLLSLPLVYGDLDSIVALNWQAAFVAGYGAAGIGELVRKGVTPVVDNKQV